MRSGLRTVALAALLIPALAPVAVGRQQPGEAPRPDPPAQGADQQRPTFRTGINFVRVDAIVSDKQGNAVTDLRAEDFEITEQGKPQAIEAFKLVSVDSPGGPPDEAPRAIHSELDEEREAARDDVRLFSIFLDDYHVRRESSLIAREQIARFVETELRPSDLIAMMYPLESISTVRLTRDHGAVAQAIRQFEGRKYDYRPRNAIEERYQNYPADTIEKIRNQVSMSAIEALIVHLGGLKEGRKALILVSEGFTGLLPPQLRDPNAAFPGLLNPQAGNPQAGVNDFAEARAAAAAAFDIDLELRQVSTAANRYNVSIYYEFGLDQSIGSQVDRQYLASTLDTLRALSSQTDGQAIVNQNNLTAGMRQIVRDTSAYYLLGYTSTFAEADGKFHEVKVRVKRPGIQVRARRGYWALNRQQFAAATAPPAAGPPKAVENALNAAVASRRSRVIRSWVGTERAASGKTQVTFVWEPAPALTGQRGVGAEQPARVVLTAASSSGAPYFRGPVPDTARRVTFEADPGPMQLRVSVEGRGSEVLDSETREIDVPDLNGLQTALATPRMFRARTPREVQQLKDDPAAVPAVGREFSRADRLLVKVGAYGPGPTPPALTAMLLGRTGQTIATLPVTLAAGDGLAQVDVPLASLAAGDYLIQIDATGAGGGAQQLVGFRVVP
jgi:VWFA-related protein